MEVQIVIPTHPRPSDLPPLYLALPEGTGLGAFNMSSVTVCGQSYGGNDSDCGRLNNVQFFFVAAMPLLLPFAAFCVARWKDFVLPGIPSTNLNVLNRVSLSLSDRNLNFRRRSIPNTGETQQRGGAVEMQQVRISESQSGGKNLFWQIN